MIYSMLAKDLYTYENVLIFPMYAFIYGILFVMLLRLIQCQVSRKWFPYEIIQQHKITVHMAESILLPIMLTCFLYGSKDVLWVSDVGDIDLFHPDNANKLPILRQNAQWLIQVVTTVCVLYLVEMAFLMQDMHWTLTIHHIVTIANTALACALFISTVHFGSIRAYMFQLLYALVEFVLPAISQCVVPVVLWKCLFVWNLSCSRFWI